MKKFITSTLMALFSLPISVLAHGNDDFDGHHAGMMSGFFGGGIGFFDWFFMIIFWIVIIAAVVFLIKTLADGDKKNSSSTNNQNKQANEDAKNILRKRYAKGEISKKEYDKMKKDLAS